MTLEGLAPLEREGLKRHLKDSENDLALLSASPWCSLPSWAVIDTFKSFVVILQPCLLLEIKRGSLIFHPKEPRRTEIRVLRPVTFSSLAC